ncbi:hypothetical protein OZD61_04315 [Wolbachia endosymbiont of Drosophila bocki]|uniref:hypothetical protein n=1 Tax=Wolbachia TaxID=953 RepID=UPI0023A984BE|nr:MULTISPECIES: hypothetical protein [unclassified Wolbachia]MDE5057989.1 hypothetical protein [Wolbachia endosymbiont of Drosophila bocki]MDE5067049.1 hypothetical protein [Wolbachia endosymbiont of Drosophila leontia]
MSGCNPSVPMMSSQCPDTGIQESLLVSKQTSTESGYNIFDEIIWKTGMAPFVMFNKVRT